MKTDVTRCRLDRVEEAMQRLERVVARTLAAWCLLALLAVTGALVGLLVVLLR